MSKKNGVKKTRNTTHIMKFHFYMFNLILSLNSLLEFKYAKKKIKQFKKIFISDYFPSAIDFFVIPLLIFI